MLFQIILNLNIEDTQKKLDKALKRNLVVQPKADVPISKTAETNLSDEEPVSVNEENLE